MAASSTYYAQVELLVRCIPAIAQTPDFALKGGTAINLFYLNMPRVSVDIDLAYLPISGRRKALEAIHLGMVQVADVLRREISQVRVRLTADNCKLLVSLRDSQVKIEINSIVRGCLLTPIESDLCKKAQQRYEQFVRVRRLSIADLYGSKLCAALDRQHPRDIFDVMLLLSEGSISDEIRQAFVVYLAQSNRPISELLAPNRRPLGDLFTRHFSGMTEQKIELRDLEDTRDQLFKWATTALSKNERRFLLSIEQGGPDWTQLPFDGLDRLPAIQWKLHNIRQMSARTHSVAIARLRDVLEL